VPVPLHVWMVAVPELVGVQSYKPAEFQEKVDWMMHRGFLKDAPAYKDVVRGK